VLLHGGMVSHYYYKPVIAELEKQFDVIALDHLGQGESDRPSPDAYRYDLPALADTVAAVMEALEVPRARVWGHSVGGAVAITLAARRPERVERLILEDAAYYPMPKTLISRLVMTPGIGEFFFLRLSSRRDLKTHFLRAYRDRSFVTDEMVDYYWERFNRAGARAANYAIITRVVGALVDNPGDPGRIQVPTLIAWGDEDRLFPLAHGKRLVTQVPGARLEVIPACGHVPHEERPDERLRSVVPFLRGEEAAPAAAGASGG
jgi:pimeloyl-ACP methyl ester carboxylesterase